MINLFKNTFLTTVFFTVIPAVLATASPAVRVPASADTAAEGSIQRFQFDFTGGSALSLISQLAEDFPDFPVVISTEAGDFVIPEFKAQITKPETIIDLISNVNGYRMRSGVDLGDGRRDESNEFERVEGSLEYRNVNNELVYMDFVKQPEFKQPSIVVEVISIQQLLTSGLGVEEIFGTVEAGIELKESGQEESRTEVRFHEATGVLFVKGTRSVNSMVSQTIEALKTSAQWRVSDEAIAAREARIKSEALDALEQVTKDTARIQQEKLERMMKDHEALMEKQRQEEDEKDAAMERAFEKEDAEEDE